MSSLTASLAAIDAARDFAERFSLDIADAHRLRFVERMDEQHGYEVPPRREEWLPYDLAILIYDYHNALERLRQQLMQAEWIGEETKKLVPDQPLLPQIENVIATHGARLAVRIDRRLEHRRQQAEGIIHYIWHTEGDERVRDSHAANDGQIFAWDSPPATGHPGDDFNCRCGSSPMMGNRQKPQELPQDQVAGLHIPAAILAIMARLEKLRRKLPKKPKVKPAPKKPVDIFKRPKGVPKDWVKETTKDGKGVIFKDPKSKGTTYIKIKKGDLNSSNNGQRVDNIRWMRNGKSLDKNGNPVSMKSEASHIPVEDFKFKPEIFK